MKRAAANDSPKGLPSNPADPSDRSDPSDGPPFPGTPLYEQLEQQGRMLAPEQWQRCTLFDVNYQPANMSPTELAEGFKRLVVKLYSDEFTKARRGRFKEIRRAYCKQKGLAP